MFGITRCTRLRITLSKRHASTSPKPLIISSSSSKTSLKHPTINETVSASTLIYKHPNSKTLKRGYYFGGLWLVFWSVFGVLQGVDYEKRRKEMVGFAISQGLSVEHLRGEKVIPFILSGTMMAVGLMPLLVIHRVNSRTIETISTLPNAHIRITTCNIIFRSTLTKPISHCSTSERAKTGYGENKAQIYIPPKTNFFLLPSKLFKSGYLKFTIQGRVWNTSLKVDRMGTFPRLDWFDDAFYKAGVK
ncbi:hypothetical protein SmJEL517_g00797 [Synchytrium microbalum]|uniref:Uncharacterized protein n=1 Tax=Synchytrium microbalum TaxID=1806994 RepID=A0A507CGK7_9FUNG|nr:uncharacterized protein SmJEL517_g00797 [Synchytrium microbalum]TPX37176.1 hypothetical protein SmJEL517_g00797 [Synchytrium microbalum]